MNRNVVVGFVVAGIALWASSCAGPTGPAGQAGKTDTVYISQSDTGGETTFVKSGMIASLPRLTKVTGKSQNK